MKVTYWLVHLLTLCLVAAVPVATLGGCAQGFFEETGESMDDAADEVGDAVDDAEDELD